MIDIALASLIAQILIGAGQIGIVYYGISRMMRANDNRAQLQHALMERQDKQSERHHAETMVALKDQSQALHALIRGMETVIERSGGRGTT